MKRIETSLPGVLLLETPRFTDPRGFFAETWNSRSMAEIGIDCGFVQDNHSISVEAGTVRGLHYQRPPHAQAKLVRCGRGALLDVAVDIRAGSPSFGSAFSAVLSAENGRQLFIPAGFAHGFMALQPETEICYKCSTHYAPEAEGAIRWDSCGIKWSADFQPLLSERDAAATPLSALESPFRYAA